MCGPLYENLSMGDRAGDPKLAPAPRVRRTLAVAVDMALAGGWTWLRRPKLRDGAAPAVEPSLFARLLAPASELVRTQIASPGERLTGVRTVDRRTGRRVQLWRTLLLVTVRAGGAELIRRSRRRDPELECERADFNRELRAVHERHRDDPAGAQAEVARVFESAPAPASAELKRSVGSIVAVSLLVSLLRRRLTPTVVIDARAPAITARRSARSRRA
jgi:hypothetical protein